MSFYKQLDKLIQQCNNFQASVDNNELWYQDPYQSKYLAINKLLKIYKEKKIAIETVAAGNQSAPGVDDFSPLRADYYALEEVVPPFLAGEHKFYFYLQTYKIECKFLLKAFSYSTFRGDWEKMLHLRDWLAEIYDCQEKHDAAGSIKKSFDDLRELSPFDKLAPKGIQLLQEEVHNIHTLLGEEPELQEQISPEDAELLQKASQFLKENKHLLKDLPEIEEFEHEEPPVLETVAYRCKQLTVLVDDFPDDQEKGAKAEQLYEFKQELADGFDLNIPICLDIHNAIEKAIGSHKKPSIKRLCKMIHKALEPFSEEDLLGKKYNNSVLAKSLDVERGIPDTIELEMMLLVAVGIL